MARRCRRLAFAKLRAISAPAVAAAAFAWRNSLASRDAETVVESDFGEGADIAL